MRWLQLFIFALLLLVPFASAEITVDQFGSRDYNLGDKVLLSGRVTVEGAIRGYLSFDLQCDEGDARVATLLVDYETRSTNTFSKSVLIPSHVRGFCKIDASLKDRNNLVVESNSFSGFNVSDSLSASFDISASDFQLGDSLDLYAAVSKKDNSPVNGVLTIYFKQNNETIFFDSVDVEAGSAHYAKDLQLVPEGDYSLDLEVKDNYGNFYFSENAFNFLVRSEIQVSLDTSSDLYLPGETVIVKGSLVPREGKTFDSISAYLRSDGLNLSITKFLGAQTMFDFDFPLSSNIPAGEHKFSLVVKDTYGNYGSMESSFSVKAVPTVLTLALDKSSFLPQEEIPFSVTLFDQSGAPLTGTVTATLLDSKSSSIETKVVDLGGSSNFVLPRLALPGEWKIAVQGFDLSDSASVTVQEHIMLDYEVVEGVLTIKNVGNVPYNQPLAFVANGQDISLPLSIPLEGVHTLELNKYLDTGVYILYFALGEKTLENVSVVRKGFFGRVLGGLGITGNAVADAKVDGESKGIQWKYVLLVFLGMVIISSLFFVFRKSKHKDPFAAPRRKFLPEEKDHLSYLKNRRKSEQIQPVAALPKKKFVLGKATEEDYEYHRNRVKEMFEKEKQGKENKEFLDQHKPKEGLFGMFN